jgi:hypothetical protein
MVARLRLLSSILAFGVLAEVLPVLSECVNTQTSASRQYFVKGRQYESAKQYTEAIPWFSKAADMGDGCAQLKLGFRMRML